MRAMSGGMRMITVLLVAALLFCSGCPNVEIPYHDGPDMPVVLKDMYPPPRRCDPRAEAPHGLRCSFGVDTICRSTVGAYDCRCECDGYWECDLVKVVCDPDAGVPHD